MVEAFWQAVLADGLTVPDERPLDEMTVELTEMLGSPDPDVRDGLAFPVLATWIDEGVYDDLLTGLGDGMAVGLERAVGGSGTDAVFVRSYSALVLTECIERDTRVGLVTPDTILRWGDRIATWLLAERDQRGFVPKKGWAHSIAHGADAIGALARSPKLGLNELTVLLDVVGDRLLAPTEAFWVAGEPDRLALAVVSILRRDVLPLSLVEPWIARIAAGASPDGDVVRHPYFVSGNAQNFLRSLHLQLSLGGPAPLIRPDLTLVLVDHLRATNPYFFVPLPDGREHG